MLKSTFRFILLFFATAVISAAAASSAYYITKNALADQNPVPSTNVVEASRLKTDTRVPSGDTMEFESYIVRLEDNSICVYALTNQTQEFLYSADIYRPDLSAEDIRLLSSGVTLNTASELTGFMENYTS